MATRLGDDSSPTDALAVGGNTSGVTTVEIENVGGRGARTVEGIKIVDVAGASAGQFQLDGDYVLDGQPVVVAGAFGYGLQKNGISTPTDGDWYLRSQLRIDPPAPPGPVPPDPTPPDPTPVPPDPTPPDPEPARRRRRPPISQASRPTRPTARPSWR